MKMVVIMTSLESGSMFLRDTCDGLRIPLSLNLGGFDASRRVSRTKQLYRAVGRLHRRRRRSSNV